VDTARHLGNFPQAFSHLALVEAAARIVMPELLETQSGMRTVTRRNDGSV